jgi:NAD(P)-dependent dehydrogenase (short-subunit alcohol dehydrogenase family)
MAVTIDPERFRYPDGRADGVRGKRVLITGAGKDGGLGQAFAMACALGGAESVGVHFYRSYEDGLDTVERIRSLGVNAFAVQADVTSPSEVWSIRSYVIRKMGGKLPNLLICNSGLSERGYLLGRVPKEVEGEEPARRRARARRAFVDNLRDSHAVVDTKVDGFLAMSHMWAGESTFAGEPLDIVYISSRQAVDPGAGVPGYVLANWAVLALPRILEVNLGRRAELITASSLALPFIRTGMTEAYVDNKKVFGRWQPRMLETREAAEALLGLLARPTDERRDATFQLNVDADEAAGADAIKVRWSRVRLVPDEEVLPWSEEAPLTYGGS